MLTIIQQLYSEIYEPLQAALSEFDILDQLINNGYLSFRLSELIAMFIAVSLFFIIIYVPIWLVVNVVRRVVIKR